MPLVSAQNYVVSLLANLTPPGATGITAPIQALVVPKTPDVNPDGIARCYVWPARGPEKRLAFPRNTGLGTPAAWKQINHDLQIFLTWDDTPDDYNLDTNFPLLIDFVMNVLRTSPNPANWIDPDSGIASVFQNLGEDMTYDYPPPRTLEPDALLRFDARISVNLWEDFQS